MYNFCSYCGMKIKDVEEISDSFFIIKFAKHICPDGSIHYFKDDMQFEEFISYSKTIETTAEEYYAFRRKLELKLRKALSDAALKARAKECNIGLYDYVDEVSENMVDEVFENMHKRLLKSRLEKF